MQFDKMISPVEIFLALLVHKIGYLSASGM